MSAVGTVSEATILEITRIFDAPPARVFAAWTEREQWQAWIGPEGVTSEVPHLDARVGGRYCVIMRLPDGRVIEVEGVFKIVDAPHTLVYTWAACGGGQQTLVTVTFRDLGERTELTLRHEGLPTREMLADHERGWNSTLNKLARFVAAPRT